MQKILFTFFIFLFLQQTVFADTPINYYVSPDGDDSNSCTEASHPCRTIKAAVDKAVPVASINIAKGIYEEEPMMVNNEKTYFEGGWNRDFSRQTCSPTGTVMETGHSTPYPGFLNYDGNSLSDHVEISLHCLTLAETTAGNIDKAINIIIGNKIVLIDFDHVHVYGFKNNALYAESRDGGKISATLTHSTFDNNPAQDGVLCLVPKTGGMIKLNIDHVLITNNGTNTGRNNVVRINSSGTGKMTTSIQNSIIAGNQVNDIAAIDILTLYDSNSVFTMINTTVVNNSSVALAVSAYDNSHNNSSLQNNILLLHTPSDDAIYLYQNDQSWITLNSNYSIVGNHREFGDHSHLSYHSSHEIHEDPLLNTAYHLKKGSPAIDAGICGTWTNNGGILTYERIAPLDDIDGDKRPGFGKFLGCDIGADEFKPFSWPMFMPAIVHQRLNP